MTSFPITLASTIQIDTTQLVCQDVFFLFTLTSKTQLRAFPSVISTRFLWALRVLCALQCACADLVCVSLSLMGAHAGWVGLVAPSQCRPVWTGSVLAPGGARPDFILTVNIH